LNINTDNNRNPPSGMGFYERLSAASKSMCTVQDKALLEVLTGFYPNVTQKELSVLNWIFWTVHDIGDGLYEEVVFRISKNEKDHFKNEKEIEDLIVDLAKKEIIQKHTGFTKYLVNVCCDCICCNDEMIFVPEMELSLRKNVDREAFESISIIFDKTMKEYFAD
jgi:hypothetical protein